jgi:hypothetical protein
MTPEETKHRALTAIRAPAFAELFGGKPIAAFSSHQLKGEDDGPFFVDVLVYALDVEGESGSVIAAVTNGMSDQRMAEGDNREQPRLKVCLDAPLMADRSAAAIHDAAHEVGPLQILSHFGGEFERRKDGTIRGFDVFDGVMRGDTNQYYRDFVAAMRGIGYQGYLSYELCHPLPVVDGQTVDIGYAHLNAQLAAEFMRDLIESESVSASEKSAQLAARC